MKLHFIILLTFFSVNSFAQKTNNGGVEISYTLQESGWPTDVKGLIDHLNEWDKDEMDAYERPEAYQGFVTSGESNAWIEEHKDRLIALGAMVTWNKKKKKYELNNK